MFVVCKPLTVYKILKIGGAPCTVHYRLHLETQQFQSLLSLVNKGHPLLDKAIDLVDEACTNVKVQRYEKDKASKARLVEDLRFVRSWMI
ncbi:hypothetical protein MKW92_009592 [Papaver armeniacum]|nr:hypothetical protein MKW92_009592 [Papaver armeniacum]